MKQETETKCAVCHSTVPADAAKVAYAPAVDMVITDVVDYRLCNRCVRKPVAKVIRALRRAYAEAQN